MDNWYQRFIKWFTEIPPEVPVTVIRKPDHVVVIVREPTVPDAEVTAPTGAPVRKKPAAQTRASVRTKPATNKKRGTK